MAFANDNYVWQLQNLALYYQAVPYVPSLIQKLGIFKVSRNTIATSTDNYGSIWAYPERSKEIAQFATWGEIGTTPNSATGWKREKVQLKLEGISIENTIPKIDVMQGEYIPGTGQPMTAEFKAAQYVERQRIIGERTTELAMMKALLGDVLDNATGRVVYNSWDLWGETQETLTPPAAGDDILKWVADTRYKVADTVQGLEEPNIVAILGDDYWDYLYGTFIEFRRAVAAAAAQVEAVRSSLLALNRNDNSVSQPLNAPLYQEFSFGGITFYRYHKYLADDTYSFPTNKAVFLPTNINNLFVNVYTGTSWYDNDTTAAAGAVTYGEPSVYTGYTGIRTYTKLDGSGRVLQYQRNFAPLIMYPKAVIQSTYTPTT